MFYHLGALYLLDPSKPYLTSIIDVNLIQSLTFASAKYGWIGVQVFFVISGMVIAASLDGKTWQDYARSRFLRLYPGVWVCTAISMACIIATHQSEASHWFSLWMRSSLISPIGPWVDGAYWTLPVEITFYGIMLVGIGRTPRTSILVAVALCLMSTLFWSLYLWAPTDSALAHWTGKVAGTFRFDVAFFQYGIYFGIGILVNRLGSRLAKFAVLAACAPICFIQIDKIAQHATEYMNAPVSSWVPFVIWLTAISLILLSTEWNELIHTKLSQRTVAWIRQIGLATYPLYLLHVTVGFAVMYVGSQVGIAALPNWLLGFAAPIALSLWVADNVEPAVRRRTALALDRITSSGRAAKAFRN